MKRKAIDAGTKKKLLEFQRSEITEHFIYEKLSRSVKDRRNSRILKRISGDELRHYNEWKAHTGEDAGPSRFKVWKYCLISRILGITFGIKLMEKGEGKAQANYDEIARVIPDAKRIETEENRHEKELISMIDEERLRYIGSIVLGLNDALVELTGALAGFTFALQKTEIIALAGLITGIAASLSMGASEYLSTKSEGKKAEKSPFRASIYTTAAYILTVMFLISPFLLLKDVFSALGITLANAIIVILVFTSYISVAKDLPFRRRFAEMAAISLGVAALSFAIGFAIRVFWGIDV